MVVAFAAALVVVVSSKGQPMATGGSQPSLSGSPATNAESEVDLAVSGITLGTDGVAGGAVADTATVSVEVVYDYICPYCQRFEDLIGAELEAAVRAGQVRLTVYPLGYLDGYSTTEYSSRSARAAQAVAGIDPEHFWAFDRALWANQPAEGGPGLSDQEIADLAHTAGVSQEAIDQFTSGAYDEQVRQTTEVIAGSADFPGTPLVLIGDGTNSYQWNWSNGDLAGAIARVEAGQEP
jgi:protein-disulfide isomerase